MTFTSFISPGDWDCPDPEFSCAAGLVNRRTDPEARKINYQLKSGAYTKIYGAGVIDTPSWQQLACAQGNEKHELFSQYMFVQFMAICMSRKDAVISGNAALWFYGALTHEWDARTIGVVAHSGFNTQPGQIAQVAQVELLRTARPGTIEYELVQTSFGSFRIQSIGQLLAQMCRSLEFSQSAVILESTCNNWRNEHRPKTRFSVAEISEQVAAARYGHKQVSALLDLANPLSESPRETELRFVLGAFDYTNIVVQPSIRRNDDDQELGRVDLMVAEVPIEYNGSAKYLLSGTASHELQRERNILDHYGAILNLDRNTFPALLWLDQLVALIKHVQRFPAQARVVFEEEQVALTEKLRTILSRYRLRLHGVDVHTRVKVGGWQSKRFCWA